MWLEIEKSENKELSNLTNISQFTLLPLSHDALVIPRPDVLEGALEVALRPVKAGVRLVLAGLQVGVDELDETVEVLGGDGLVLLVKVVDVTVEDLDKELDGNSSVHAGICDSQSALETLEDSFPITVELAGCQYWCSQKKKTQGVNLHSGDLRPRAAGSRQPTRGDLQGTLHGTDRAS